MKFSKLIAVSERDSVRVTFWGRACARGAREPGSVPKRYSIN